MSETNEQIAEHWAMNRKIVEALGWRLKKLDTPEILEGDDPYAGHYRMVLEWTMVDGNDNPVMSSWQTPELVWEHAPIPDYGNDLALAWGLLADIPKEFTPRMVRVLTPFDGELVYSTKAVILNNETGDGEQAIFRNPAMACCQAWLLWHRMNVETDGS